MRPAWPDEIADCAQQALHPGGEQVTLTAKRRMMTPAEVADAMGVSLHDLSKDCGGILPAVKVGNRNRIPYEEFERFWQWAMGEVVELTRGDIRGDLFGGP